MDEPLTFTDEQLLAAFRAAPEPFQNQLMIIAMQQELAARRADDNPPDGAYPDG